MNCYWCNTKIIKIEKDHFLPYSHGGRQYKNLVQSCLKCNRSKSNRIWIKSLTGEVLKPKKRPLRFTKVIEHEKYFETVLSFVSLVPKKNKGGKSHYPFPKNHDYSNHGIEIDSNWQKEL